MNRRPVVLLVEDNPDDLALMRLAIRELASPFETVVAEDAEQALIWLHQYTLPSQQPKDTYPALVLLDLNLPGLGGLDFLRALRNEPRGCLIPVVVLTTSEMPTDIAAAYELGANAFVQKPMAFPMLVDLVASLQRFWLSFNVLHPVLR